MTELSTDGVELLSVAEVLARTRLSQATLFRLRSRKEFPEPLALGRLRADGRPTNTAWRSDVIAEWIATRAVGVSSPTAYSEPNGAHIVVRPGFKHARDAEAFARELGGRIHAIGPRCFSVWFGSRGAERDSRICQTLAAQRPGFEFLAIEA